MVVYMVKRNSIILAGALVLALAFLVVPVAAAPTIVSISPTSGTTAGGTTVTITGTEFSNTTAVTFDGIAATSFTVNSATQITAITPAHAASGAVSVIVAAPEGNPTGTYSYASAPTISSISPTSAANSGGQTVVITGSGFSGPVAVTLTKTGQSTITGTLVGTDSATTLSRNFPLNGVEAGTWTLVVLNTDGGTTSTSFTVNTATAATVTSISPTSGKTNSTVSVTIKGTGFTAASAKIRLYRSGNYIVGTVNAGGSATQLTGSDNLDMATPGSYQVCVLPTGVETSVTCGPSFTVQSSLTANGSIYFTSSPSGATVYVDSVKKGTTPFTLENVIPDYYNIKMQRTSYLDWAKRIQVTAGNETTVNAPLTYQNVATTAPTVTTIIVTTATLPPTTVKSTAVVPTPWPSNTPAPESPVGIFVLIGALASVMILLRKNQ